MVTKKRGLTFTNVLQGASLVGAAYCLWNIAKLLTKMLAVSSQPDAPMAFDLMFPLLFLFGCCASYFYLKPDR